MYVKQPMKISLREFLMPEEALKSTGAFENPLLTYSLRRGRRWPRRIAQHLLEVALLVVGFLLITNWHEDMREQYLLLFPLSFLLLRYHLLVNDQSHHLKTLRADHLQQLFLTRLEREDYFLHHYLYFCRNYRVIWGFAGLLIATFIYGGLFGKIDWLIWQFVALLFGICLVLLTWLAGVMQYTMEWRIFAGGQSPIAQSIGTWFISLLLAFLTMLAAQMLTSSAYNLGGESIPLGLLFLFPGLPLILLAAAALVHWQGLGVYQDATELLWRRFAKEDPDWQVSSARRKTRTLDWLLPWRCFIFPKGEEATHHRFSQYAIVDGFSSLISGLVLSAGFFCSWAFFFFIDPYRIRVFMSAAPLFAIAQFIFTKLPIVILAGYVAGRTIRARERGIPFSPRLLLVNYGRWFMLLCLVLSIVTCGTMFIQNDFIRALSRGMVTFYDFIQMPFALLIYYLMHLSCSYLLLTMLLSAGQPLFSRRRSAIIRCFFLLTCGAGLLLIFMIASRIPVPFLGISGSYYYYGPWFELALPVFEKLFMTLLALAIVNTIINRLLAPLPKAVPLPKAAAAQAAPPPLRKGSRETG